MFGEARDRLFDVLNQSGAATYRRQVELAFAEAARETGEKVAEFRRDDDARAGWHDQDTSNALNHIIHERALGAVERSLAMHRDLSFVAGRPTLLDWLRRKVAEHAADVYRDFVHDRFAMG